MNRLRKNGRPPMDDRAVAAWRHYRHQIVSTRSLAKHLGVSQPAVSKWQQVPKERLAAVAAYIGVPAYALRPDLDPFSALDTKGK